MRIPITLYLLSLVTCISFSQNNSGNKIIKNGIFYCEYTYDYTGIECCPLCDDYGGTVRKSKTKLILRKDGTFIRKEKYDIEKSIRIYLFFTYIDLWQLERLHRNIKANTQKGEWTIKNDTLILNIKVNSDFTPYRRKTEQVNDYDKYKILNIDSLKNVYFEYLFYRK